jgi:Tol biopolymer transport system component
VALESGSRLGPYEILACIGAGGMGEVYRARDTRLARDVAIKISAQQFSERFEREARVIASVNHPNICTLHDVGPNYLVMELVEGTTLADRIKDGPIPLEESLAIAKQIADALEAAHEQGITHRDLKPANIKIKPDGMVKVLDFGLAKSGVAQTIQTNDSPTIATGLTQAGVIIGTVAYMSPEQAKGKPADKRSDIWAFGVVLYEMLTGAQLFQGETFSETLAAVLRHEVDWKPIAAKAERLLRRCLDRDPKLRLRDIGDYRLLLEDMPRERASSSRLGLVGWAVAAVSLAALVVTVFLPRTEKTQDRPLIRLSLDLGSNYVPLTGGQFAAAISPDGTKLVYGVRTGQDTASLALRPLDQDRETLLPGTENASGSPFFSPDGRWIGFYAYGGTKMKKVAVQGGAPIEWSTRLSLASWCEDGSIVGTLGATGGLWRMPDTGGMPQTLTTLAKREVRHSFPQMLPGGNAVLFTASPSVLLQDLDDATIQVVSIKTGKTKTLITGGYAGRYVPSYGKRGHLIYAHRGSVFAVPFDPVALELLGPAVPVLDDVGATNSGFVRFDSSGATSGTGTFIYLESPSSPKWPVVWLDSSGKTLPLPVTSDTYTSLRLSPDGQRLAVSVNSKGNDLYVYNIPRDQMTRLTADGQTNLNPVWTPDGNHLVFTSRRGLSWIRADGGGEAQLLLPGNFPPVPSSFSPDGKRLAYSTRDPDSPGANSDIWLLPLDLSDPEHPKMQKPEVFLNSPAPEVQPAFSPEGRWIAYVLRTSGADDVWVRPFPGPSDNRWQISTGGGSSPIWSQTGSQLFFRKTGGEIMVVDYVTKGDTFEAQKPRVWSEHQVQSPIGDGRSMDLAPDGKRFAILERPPERAQPNTRLIFLLNFFDELRRRAPEGN